MDFMPYFINALDSAANATDKGFLHILVMLLLLILSGLLWLEHRGRAKAKAEIDREWLQHDKVHAELDKRIVSIVEGQTKLYEMTEKKMDTYISKQEKLNEKIIENMNSINLTHKELNTIIKFKLKLGD
jgi:uncharacterized protein YdcH (DUF465 family)